jgi:riboflavin biosynthesis pyrimidine reductase
MGDKLPRYRLIAQKLRVLKADVLYNARHDSRKPENVVSDLSPFETLVDDAVGDRLPLTDELARIYGDLRFAERPADAPLVIASFVETLDGVVALGGGGTTGGAEISGGSRHDRLVLGLLRAAADAIVVGSGTVRALPRHRWTLENLVPGLTDELTVFRERLGKPGLPSVAVVTGSGQVEPEWRLFQTGEDRLMVVTSARGARHVSELGLPSSVRVIAVGESGDVGAAAVVSALRDWRAPKLILIEGGPTLLGRFLADRQLDQIFLTLSPWLAGRDREVARLSLVEGVGLTPGDARWGRLVTLKRMGSHLFARYAFETGVS